MQMADLPLGTFATVLLLTLLPFAVPATTSFVKMSVVLSALRNALGFGSIPSAMVVTLLAALLSVHVMAPVVERAAAAGAGPASRIDLSQPLAGESAEALGELWRGATAPVRTFLQRHAHGEEVDLFRALASEARGLPIAQTDLTVLLPAFLISELAEAFQIAFLLLLPFVALDLAVAAVLGAMQLQLVPPTLVSLPLKVLLFLAVDGFAVLSEALVKSYL